MITPRERPAVRAFRIAFAWTMLGLAVTTAIARGRLVGGYPAPHDAWLWARAMVPSGFLIVLSVLWRLPPRKALVPFYVGLAASLLASVLGTFGMP
jgi:hypothetical protein